MIVVGIDIGGTFTDVVLLDVETGAVHTSKVLSTPDDLVRGVIEGLAVALDTSDRLPSDVVSLVHGTTIITNAIIERRGETTGLIANAGFRDVVEIGSEMRYDVFDLQLRLPEPLVARSRRLGIAGRMDALGIEIAPLDEDEVVNVARQLRELGVGSIAVALLHSYANGGHENRIRDLIRDCLGAEFPVTLSHDIAPEIGEFERTSTACANAYVMPLAADYLGRLADELDASAITSEPHVMASNGGLVDIAEAIERPVGLIESGPAGGAIAAGYIAELVGIDDVLSFDMGGTTAKLCFLPQRRPRMAYSFEAARLQRYRTGSGIPLSIPVIEMIEIGAGGGSVAHQDLMGLLAVGPRSAGALPGPACYGRGGSEPTVTDADVVAGLIGPHARLGGRMRLNPDLAVGAVSKLGAQVNLSSERLAEGILVQVVESMAQAARLHAAERNIDLRNFDMIAFGGAGPVHAYFLAKRLGAHSVYFPAGAGVFSAYGFTVAESRVDVSRSCPGLLDELDWDDQREILTSLRQKGEARLARLDRGSLTHEHAVDLIAEMQIRGQGFVLQVPVDWEVAYSRDLISLRRAFSTAYRSSYGVTAPSDEVELMTWRLTLRNLSRVHGLEHRWTDVGKASGRVDSREVRLPAFGLDGKIPVVNRVAVPIDAELGGPLLIDDINTSIVVGADASVSRRESGDLIMMIGAQ